MSKKANPALIGGFVVGAAVLAVAGIAFFGGGKLFAEQLTFVSYFEGSLKGLQVGAPVTFRGVRIGAVSDIVVRYNSDDQSVRIVVYFQIERDRIHTVHERSRDRTADQRDAHSGADQRPGDAGGDEDDSGADHDVERVGLGTDWIAHAHYLQRGLRPGYAEGSRRATHAR